jgi:hypothetical protein
LHGSPDLLPKRVLLGWRCVSDKGRNVTVRRKRLAWAGNNQNGIATQVGKFDHAV